MHPNLKLMLAGYRYLNVVAHGADGGRYDDKWEGGKGAQVVAFLTIGNGPGEIPPHSILRMIPGQRGGNQREADILYEAGRLPRRILVSDLVPGQ